MDGIVSILDKEFVRLHKRSVGLASAIPPGKLFWQPVAEGGEREVHSCGEHILRSAAFVEQTFGGITVNLWDDPFEWTLPETLSTTERVVEYLEEVESTRKRGFALFKNDDDLQRTIALPSGEMESLLALILATLARASSHQGQALATFRLISDQRLPLA